MIVTNFVSLRKKRECQNSYSILFWRESARALVGLQVGILRTFGGTSIWTNENVEITFRPMKMQYLAHQSKTTGADLLASHFRSTSGVEICPAPRTIIIQLDSFCASYTVHVHTGRCMFTPMASTLGYGVSLVRDKWGRQLYSKVLTLSWRNFWFVWLRQLTALYSYSWLSFVEALNTGTNHSANIP